MKTDLKRYGGRAKARATAVGCIVVGRSAVGLMRLFATAAMLWLKAGGEFRSTYGPPGLPAGNGYERARALAVPLVCGALLVLVTLLLFGSAGRA